MTYDDDWYKRRSVGVDHLIEEGVRSAFNYLRESTDAEDARHMLRAALLRMAVRFEEQNTTQTATPAENISTEEKRARGAYLLGIKGT